VRGEGLLIKLTLFGVAMKFWILYRGEGEGMIFNIICVLHVFMKKKQ